MRSVPGYPNTNDVLTPAVRVEHNRQPREVNRLSLTRELPSSFHAQVLGFGEVTQATGSVEWAALSDVVETHPTAFGRTDEWPPSTRDRIDVFTGLQTAAGDLLVKQLTGSVSGSNGDPKDPTSSNIVDRMARLTRKVHVPPLLHVMPPLTPGGAWRGVTIYPMFFTDRAARSGGFNSTPGMGGGCVFSAPLMGSAWPERGTLITGLRFADRNNPNAWWHETVWGMGVSNAYLSYAPVGDSALTRPMEITAMAPLPPYAGRAYVAARWGDSEVRLNFNNSSVYAMVNGVVVCEMGAVDGNVFTLRAVPSGGTLALTLRDAAGREAAGSVAIPDGVGAPMTEALVVSEVGNAAIGGAQISFPSVEWEPVTYTRSAYISPAAHNAPLPATRPIIGMPAKDLIEEQARAELAAWWIDGAGAFRWVNRDRLVAGPSLATLTTRDHISTLPWEEDFGAVSYSVEVKGLQADAIQQSKTARHEIWQSNYGDVDADGSEVFEELLHPDADEDWIMVDTSFNNDNTARLEGSEVALYFFFESGTKGNAGYATQEGSSRQWAGASLAQIDHRTYKLVTTVYGVNAGGYERSEFSLKIPSERQGPTPGGWPAGLGGTSFPIIRAYAKVMWADSVSTALTGATQDAPTLTHDVGWWVQDAGARQRIADFLAASTATPRPVLRGVSVEPDARRELGDIVTLSDPEVTGMDYRCLIVGIDDSIGDRWEQSCTFRVLSTTKL